MNGRLIRSTALGQARVRRLGAPAAETVEAAPSALEREHEALSTRVVDLEQALERARRLIEKHDETLAEAIAAARTEGRAAGVDEGRRQADQGREAALAALEEGLRAALTTQSDQIGALEILAVQIARSGLARILGPQAPQGDLIATIVRDQVRRLAGEAMVRVEVSATDFSDPAALADLAQDLGGVEIAPLARLPTGACRIVLRLGELEVGAAGQWRALAEVFDAWLIEEGAA
jgi:flagellar biosynthesis/type III secretory pathway protein FliH